MVPIDKFTFREIPCANTLQGEAPVKTQLKAPHLNQIKLNQNTKKEMLRFLVKINGLSELHQHLEHF